MIRHEQATAHKVVHACLALLQRAVPGANGRGDDRVVIRDLGIIHETCGQGRLSAARGHETRIAGGDGVDHGAEADRHVRGQVPAVRARIGQKLVLFIQGLGVPKHLLGRHAIQAVGVALQFGQVVQQGCGLRPIVARA